MCSAALLCKTACSRAQRPVAMGRLSPHHLWANSQQTGGAPLLSTPELAVPALRVILSSPVLLAWAQVRDAGSLYYRHTTEYKRRGFRSSCLPLHFQASPKNPLSYLHHLDFCEFWFWIQQFNFLYDFRAPECFFKAVVVTATSKSLFILYWGRVALQCS